MALRRCPECKNEFSTSVKACPHCGYKDKSGYMAALGVVAIVVMGLGILAALLPDQDRKTSEIVKPCDFYRADDLVQEMLKLGVLYRVDSGEFPRIYVKDAWYLLPIDKKAALDASLQCHLGRGKGDKLGVYRDYRTGKDVASTGGVRGFSME